MRIPAKISPPKQMMAPAYIAKVLNVPMICTMSLEIACEVSRIVVWRAEKPLPADAVHACHNHDGVGEGKNDPNAGKRSRVSVLLANKNFDQTLTITHTLWSMSALCLPERDSFGTVIKSPMHSSITRLLPICRHLDFRSRTVPARIGRHITHATAPSMALTSQSQIPVSVGYLSRVRQQVSEIGADSRSTRVTPRRI
jgi:hypothetical protein